MSGPDILNASSSIIFKNEDLNEQFLKTGLTIVNLDDKEILIETYNRIQIELNQNISDLKGFQNNNSNVSFHSTFLDTDKVYKKIVRKHLTPLFNGILQRFLVPHKVIQVNIFNKLPNTGFVSPHQNLTTVDEDYFTSLSIWIPLQDTTERNGCLFFLPGSNKKFEKFRNPYIYWPPLNYSTNIGDYKMKPISMFFGQALIFDDSIVHASPDNYSDKARLAFHALAIPDQVKPIYPRKNGDYIELIEVDDDFWFNYSPGEEEPSSPVIRKVAYAQKTYSKSDFECEK